MKWKPIYCRKPADSRFGDGKTGSTFSCLPVRACVYVCALCMLSSTTSTKNGDYDDIAIPLTFIYSSYTYRSTCVFTLHTADHSIYLFIFCFVCLFIFLFFIILRLVISCFFSFLLFFRGGFVCYVWITGATTTLTKWMCRYQEKIRFIWFPAWQWVPNIDFDVDVDSHTKSKSRLSHSLKMNVVSAAISSKI